MTERATFTLEPEAFAFLAQSAGKNRSAYINRLLMDEKRRQVAARVARANAEEAGDDAYQQELAAWDVTLGDGLSA